MGRKRCPQGRLRTAASAAHGTRQPLWSVLHLSGAGTRLDVLTGASTGIENAGRTYADYPILYRHRSRYRYFYFYLRDEVLGPMIVRMGTFIPFEASYYLNGHSYIERELRRRGVGFRKEDKCFRFRGRPPAPLQAAFLDGLSGEIIQKRLNYWTVLLGPEVQQTGPAERETGAQLLRIRLSTVRTSFSNAGIPSGRSSNAAYANWDCGA